MPQVMRELDSAQHRERGYDGESRQAATVTPDIFDRRPATSDAGMFLGINALKEAWSDFLAVRRTIP